MLLGGDEGKIAGEKPVGVPCGGQVKGVGVGLRLVWGQDCLCKHVCASFSASMCVQAFLQACMCKLFTGLSEWHTCLHISVSSSVFVVEGSGFPGMVLDREKCKQRHLAGRV